MYRSILGELQNTGPTSQLTQLLSKATGKKNYLAKYWMKAIADELLPPKPELPTPIPVFSNIDVWHDGPFKGKKPNFVEIGTWACPVNSWRDFVQSSVNIMYYDDPDNFSQIVEGYLTGERRIYFANNPKLLSKKYFRVGSADGRHGGSDFFAESNLSANNSVRFIQRLAESLGYSHFAVNAD